MSATANGLATASLSLSSLERLPKNVARPNYDRSSLNAGILHLGPGNFHRSHQAVYLDGLMNQGLDRDWAIIGASIMPGDARLRDSLLSQDLLNTVVTQSAAHSEARVTGAMIDYLPVGDTQAILRKMADPAIRIVSLTVTEGGYFVDAATGSFNATHPAIVADAATIDDPKTVFGLIVAALANRREHGQRAFTVMSCDNLPHNGHAAKAAVLGLARQIDDGLADWIEVKARFPNGMVDRITPATGELERKRVRSLFGVEDQCPVFCEDYLQWVLEDDFADGRPAFEKVGVQIVPDVSPYELMKIRILNGGHAVLAYPSALLGIEFVHEAMQNDLVRSFLEKVQKDEILPQVPPVPGVDLNAYQQKIVERFANPAVADTITRLCFDGGNRQPKFIVPTLMERLKLGGDITGLALTCALWCRYCQGVREDGERIRANDPAWDHLQERAHAAEANPGAWLGMSDVYGDLGSNETVLRAFAQALTGLRDKGVATMLEQYLASSPKP